MFTKKSKSVADASENPVAAKRAVFGKGEKPVGLGDKAQEEEQEGPAEGQGSSASGSVQDEQEAVPEGRHRQSR
jgi:hypothetical protein